MGKKNLVTLKGIYVTEDNEKDQLSAEEFKEQFIEIMYQWYKANQGQSELVKRHQRKEEQE